MKIKITNKSHTRYGEIFDVEPNNFDWYLITEKLGGNSTLKFTVDKKDCIDLREEKLKRICNNEEN